MRTTNWRDVARFTVEHDRGVIDSQGATVSTESMTLTYQGVMDLVARVYSEYAPEKSRPGFSHTSDSSGERDSEGLRRNFRWSWQALTDTPGCWAVDTIRVTVTSWH